MRLKRCETRHTTGSYDPTPPRGAQPMIAIQRCRGVRGTRPVRATDISRHRLE
jgi:hypothetical protein